MEQRYWEQFARTGRVEDYLFYKGMELCRRIMEKYEEQSVEPVDHGDGDGAVGIARGRI